MSFPVQAKDIGGQVKQVELEKYPQECPICHRNLFPKYCYAAIHMKKNHRLDCAFQCTNPDCERLFIGEYKEYSSSNKWYFSIAVPIYPSTVKFSEQINKVSESFVEIYNQVIHAESQNLNQLSGIGLRKALEFLVKDFAIFEKTDESENIKKTPLSKCINNYIDDTKIKTCAKLATWLGNDETHYIRKWEDKDIGDLKILIKLTVNWIENYILTEEYKKDMHDEKSDSNG